MGTPSSSSTVSVQSKGLSGVDRRILGMSALLSPVYVAFIVFLTNGGWRSDTPLKIATAVFALIFTCLLFLEVVSHPRRVDISEWGVSFRYRLHRERARWEDIDPLVRPAWECTPAVGSLQNSPLLRAEEFGKGPTG
jgi:hypothetical protein